MYLTKEELNERLNNEKNFLKDSESALAPRLRLVEHKPLHAQLGHTKKKGDNQIPPFIRALIGSAAIEGNGKEVAETFDVSLPTVYQAKEGNKSSGTPDEEARPVLESRVDRIKEQALDMTLKALEGITEDKLFNAKAKDLAAIASSSAGVYEKLKGRETNSGAQVIIYAPQLRQESEYNEVHIGNTEKQ